MREMWSHEAQYDFLNCTGSAKWTCFTKMGRWNWQRLSGRWWIPLLSLCSFGVCSSKAFVCLSTSYSKQKIILGLKFHMKLGFHMINQGLFPSSPPHTWSVYLFHLNTGILHALPGDAGLAFKTSLFRVRDILSSFRFFHVCCIEPGRRWLYFSNQHVTS